MNFLINSEFFSVSTIAFAAKYSKTIDITEHNLLNGVVIIDTCVLKIVSKLTTDANTFGTFAVVTAVIIFVNGFLFFEFTVVKSYLLYYKMRMDKTFSR